MSREVAGGDVVVGVDVDVSIVETGGLLTAIAALRRAATRGAGTEGGEAMIMPPATSVFTRKRRRKKRVVRTVAAPGNVVDCVIHCDDGAREERLIVAWSGAARSSGETELLSPRMMAWAADRSVW